MNFDSGKSSPAGRRASFIRPVQVRASATKGPLIRNFDILVRVPSEKDSRENDAHLFTLMSS